MNDLWDRALKRLAKLTVPDALWVALDVLQLHEHPPPSMSWVLRVRTEERGHWYWTGRRLSPYAGEAHSYATRGKARRSARERTNWDPRCLVIEAVEVVPVLRVELEGEPAPAPYTIANPDYYPDPDEPTVFEEAAAMLERMRSR